MRLPMMRLALVVILGPLASPAVAAGVKTEKLNGYAEWRRDGIVIVDGQRVLTDRSTKFKGKILNPEDVPLGYEVRVKGIRTENGALLAKEFEARPNGSALFEGFILQATNQVEGKWLSDGRVTASGKDGREQSLGRVVTEGREVERLRRVMKRVAPPYVNLDNVRLYVVRSRDWNAMAMENGAIWVFSGLMQDMDDDELAVVVAHELVHYTHEHTRRQFKRDMWLQLVAAGVAGVAEAIDNKKARAAVQIAAAFSAMLLQNGYGRDLEDQADRVGLRYAHEGGYAVNKAPRVWQQFLEKYGETDRVTNFFFADHSRASDRMRNIQREIVFNYQEAAAMTEEACSLAAPDEEIPGVPMPPGETGLSQKRKTFPETGESSTRREAPESRSPVPPPE